MRPIALVPRLSLRAPSLEFVEDDTGPRPVGKAHAVLALVVQVVLVDGQEGQVRLAADQPLASRKPQQLLETRQQTNDAIPGER